MPHYFFHLHNALDVPDPEGEEYANFELAKAAGLRYARDMVASSAVELGTIDLDHFVEIVSETAGHMLTITFGDAVRFMRGDAELSPGWK